LGVDYGGPTAFDALFQTRQNCDSLVHVTLLERDSSYHLYQIYRFDSTDWQMPDSVLKSCDPTVLELRDSTLGAAAWNWAVYMADTVLVSVDSSITLNIDTGQVSMMAYVNLIVTDTLGCYDTVGWPLFVFQSAKPDFQWHPDLPAMHNPEVQFENITWPDTVTYLWRIQQIEGGAFDTTSETNPFYHWGEDGDNMVGDYTVRLISMWSHSVDSFRVDTVQWVDTSLHNAMVYEAFTHACIDSIEHIVTITNDFLQFPNLVTPNGDGTNDTWVIVNLIEFGNYSMNELWIYDRTGAQVYHVKNIRHADQFWDPNATRSPDGTYYYRFSAKGEYGLVKRNGLIEVMR
jgi:gliding motility-associated-like protein